MHPHLDLDLLKWVWLFITSCQSNRVKHFKNIVWLWVEVLFNIASETIIFIYFFLVYFIIYITPLFLFLNSIWWVYLYLVHFLTFILLHGFSRLNFDKWPIYIPQGNIILGNFFVCIREIKTLFRECIFIVI